MEDSNSLGIRAVGALKHLALEPAGSVAVAHSFCRPQAEFLLYSFVYLVVGLRLGPERVLITRCRRFDRLNHLSRWVSSPIPGPPLLQISPNGWCKLCAHGAFGDGADAEAVGCHSADNEYARDGYTGFGVACRACRTVCLRRSEWVVLATRRKYRHRQCQQQWSRPRRVHCSRKSGDDGSISKCWA